MASVLSDDEGEERSHPLAQERPGVYVQVVSPRRRKARKSQQEAPSEQAAPQQAAAREAAPQQVAAREAAPPQAAAQTEPRAAHVAELVAEDAPALGSILDSAIDAHPRTASQLPAAPESERPSGEREIIAEAPAGYVRSVSQNSNGRADGVIITLPPPPRVPTFLNHGLSQIERDFARNAIEPAPSVLDAPTSMRAAPAPARRVPWGMVALVAALSAIVASAVVVALRGSDGVVDAAPGEPQPDPPPAAPPADLRRQQAEPVPVVTTPPASQPPAAAAAPTSAPAPLRQLPKMGPGGVIAPSTAAAPSTAPAPGPAAAPRAAAQPPSPQRALPPAAAPAAGAQRPPAGVAAPATRPAVTPAPSPSAAPKAAPAASAEPSEPAELPDNPYAE